MERSSTSPAMSTTPPSPLYGGTTTAKSYGSLRRSGSSGGENMSLQAASATAAAATRRTRFTRQVYYNAAMPRYSLVVTLFVGCASSTANAQLQPAPAETLSVACDDLDLPSLAAAIERELPTLERDRAMQVMQLGGQTVHAAD